MKTQITIIIFCIFFWFLVIDHNTPGQVELPDYPDIAIEIKTPEYVEQKWKIRDRSLKQKD